MANWFKNQAEYSIGLESERSRSQSAKGFHNAMKKPPKAENHCPWKMPRPFASGELGGYIFMKS